MVDQRRFVVETSSCCVQKMAQDPEADQGDSYHCDDDCQIHVARILKKYHLSHRSLKPGTSTPLCRISISGFQGWQTLHHGEGFRGRTGHESSTFISLSRPLLDSVQR